jgi:branched-chain amino acid transport system substrate-binding protein
MKYVVVGMVVLLLVGCMLTGRVVDSNDLKIGALLDLSNDGQAYAGQAMKEGIDLAVAEQNAKGGIHGRQVRIIYEDTQMVPSTIASASHKLLQEDEVAAAFISMSPEAMVAGPIFEEAHVPLVVIWDSNEDIEALGNYSYGLGLWARSASEPMADYAYNTLQYHSVAIIAEQNQQWSLLVADFFKARYEALGGHVSIVLKTRDDERDFRTLLQKVQSTDAQAVFAPLTTPLPTFMMQARDAGVQVLTSDAISQTHIDAAKDAANGVYYSNAYVDESTPSLQALSAAYRNMYGHEPKEILITGLGYDAAQVLMQAIARSDGTSEDINAQLATTVDFPGVFGTVSMTPGGAFKRMERIFVVENGRGVLVK